MGRPSNDEMYGRALAILSVGDLVVTDDETERVYDRLEGIRARTGYQYRVLEAVTGQTVIARVR